MTGLLSKQATDDLTGRIKSPAVLDAFDFLVRGMADLGRFELRDNARGNKKSLHFVTGRVSYSAFVANNEWLLWYFRKPGFRDKIFTWKGLKEVFPDLESSKRADPEDAEAILKIRRRRDAETVLEFVSKSSG